MAEGESEDKGVRAGANGAGGGEVREASIMPMVKTRLAWEDKFRRPKVEELFDHYPSKQLEAVAQAARARLREFTEVEEKIEWQGMPWRWTLTYTCEMDPTRAWVYLIPDPAKVQLCIPLTTSMVQSLPMRRLKKVIRDGIVYSKFVAGTYWPCWDVPAKTNLEELIDLAGRKHKYVRVGSDLVTTPNV